MTSQTQGRSKFTAMLDSLSKTMSRSSGLVATIKEKKAGNNISSSSSSTLGGGSLGRHAHSTSTGSGGGHFPLHGHHKTFPARVVFLDDTAHTFQVFFILKCVVAMSCF